MPGSRIDDELVARPLANGSPYDFPRDRRHVLVILAEMYLDRTGDAADLDKEVFKVNRVERDGAIRRIGSGGEGRQLAAEAKPKQRDFAVAKAVFSASGERRQCR